MVAALVILVVVVIGVAVALGFGSGLIHIQRMDDREDEEIRSPAENKPYYPFQEGPRDQPDPSAEAQPDVDPEEEAAMARYDYFEEAPAEAPVQAPAEEQENERDKLCGLPTGRGYMVDAQKILNQAAGEKIGYSLVYLDFDRFRLLNSLKGQSIGDHALSRMAQELVEIFKPDASVTRVSADHFAVLFPMADEAVLQDRVGQVKRAADRIRDELGAKSGLKVSVGVAVAVQAKDYNICMLMQAANIARHCTKNAKDAEYAVYSGDMVETYLFGESAMDEYGDNQYDEDIAIYYQPLYDLTKNRTTGFEALTRWRCELASNRQVSLTPDNGRLPVNNPKVIYQVCRLLGRWQKAGVEVQDACVNIAATDLYREDIDEFIARCLAAFQIDPQRLIISADINAVRLDWSVAGRQLKKLRDIGARTAVYGIDRAYTSLDVLHGLPVDFVKLHRSFARGVTASAETADAVRDIIASAQANGSATIFEGVKSVEELRLLKAMGARMTQGGIAGYAMEADELPKALGEMHLDRSGSGTTILNDDQLAKGNFNVY